MNTEYQSQSNERINLWDPLAVWPGGRRWVWLALTAWVCLFQGPYFVRSLWPEHDKGVDFFQDWASARNLFNGLPVYTSHRITIPRYLGYEVNPIGEKWVTVEIDMNAHPPTSVLLMLPLAALDYPEAVLVWNLLSLAMLIASVWLIAHHRGITLSLWSLCPLIIFLLLSSPFRQQMNQGQLNLFLLLLLTGTWVAAESARPGWAGLLLGTATAVKVFPGFLFAYFILQRRWKIVVTAAIALVALSGLTATVIGFESYQSYFNDVLPQTVKFRSGWLNASLLGFWTKLFDPATEQRVEPLWRSPTLATVGTLVSCLLVVAVLAWIIRQRETRTVADRAFGLAVTAMLLVSPITWDHYFTLLLIPLALVWLCLPKSPTRRVFFLATVVALCFHPSAIYDAFVPGGYRNGVATPVHTVTVLSYGCYALLGLFILGVLAIKDEKGVIKESDNQLALGQFKT